MKIAGIASLALVAAVGARAADKPPKCFDDMYEGHCVAAQVNGQKTVRIGKQAKKLLKGLEEGSNRSFNGCSTNYEIPAPVRGPLDLRFSWLPEAVSYFGQGAEASVSVTPLEGQKLSTRPEISSAPSVHAGGSTVMTRADVVDGNRLPAGKYVFTARVSGSNRGWDCHGFFVQVAE